MRFSDGFTELLSVSNLDFVPDGDYPEDIMKRYRPQRYTILIAGTGKEPITFSFQPWALMLLLALSVSFPTVWIYRIVQSYIHRNTQLVEQNTQLTEEASTILQQVESLEGEIDNLQERAGISDVESSVEKEKSFDSQGGLEIPVEAEVLLAIAKSKLPGLVSDLKGEVRPALEETLDREEAHPTGIPIKGIINVTSEFGLRQNPFGRNYEFHAGLDFRGAYGSPIHTTAPGVVIKAEWSGGYGYHVIVDHGYGYQTLYAHLSGMAVKSGMRIERDRVVGYLGNTGRSSGPHLHYGVYRNGHAVNPKDYLN